MKTLIMAIVAVSCLATVALAESREPSAQVEALVKRLQTGKWDGAFVDFFAGSLFAEQKSTELHALDVQAKAVFEFYGRPMDYAIVETKKMGNSIVRIKWITKHKSETPLFWNGLFYRRNDKWEPFTISFFDNPEKAQF